MLCNHFKCGKIYKVSEKYSRYQVENIQDLKEKIIPHFDKYTLQSTKAKDYQVFKEIINDLDKEMHEPQKTLQEKKIFIKNCVEKAYEMNCHGKRRRLTKKEYIEQINEMKV